MEVSGLQSFIKLYKKFGFNIIPLTYMTKEPAVQWGEFQNHKVTEDEVKRWFSKKEVNIGIICGSISNNLVVLDFDGLDAFKRFFEKSPEEVAEETLVVKTARGYHVYFRTDRPIESFKIRELELDVKAEKSYVAAPPSIHPTGVKYEFIGDPWKLDHLLSIDDLERWIWDRAAELGIFRYGSAEDPPCIRMLLNGVSEGVRNESAIRLASYWIQFRKLEPREVFNRLLEWNLRNSPPLDEKELKSCLESVLKHGYEYGCSGMVELGLCNDRLKSICNLGESLQVKKKYVRYVPSAVLQDGRLIEEAYRDGKIFFIVYDPKTGDVSELEEVEDGGIIYKPMVNRDVETGQVLLPSKAEDYVDEKLLFQEVMNFLNYWHEQPNGFERILDVLYVFMSWIYDALPKLPYRRALGRWGSGKSAWLETVGSICYRPMVLAGCDSEASLRRTFDMWRGTALIDEADFNNSSLYASIVKILNIGFSRDAGWYRCCNDKDPKIIDSFYVYGAKLLATRGEFKDVALESRCLTFIARKGSGEAPLFRADKFKAEALSLRNKLLAWRFRNFQKIVKVMAVLEERGLFKSMFSEKAEPRVAQIILPLCLMFESEQLKANLKELVEKKTEEIKALDPEAWLEEEIPGMLKELAQAQLEKLEEEKPGYSVSLVSQVSEPGRILSPPPTEKTVAVRVKDVAEKLVGDELDGGELKSLAKKISKFIRERLGFTVKRSTGNYVYAYIPASFFSGKTEGLTNLTNSTNSLTEKVGEKKQALLCEENFKALFEAVKSFGSDYWEASEVVDEYVRAGGRDFWRLLDALSGEEWLKTNPAFWLEAHPNLPSMFRLRRR